MKIFYIEKEFCCRHTKELHCFHVRFLGYSLLGKKDGHWYICLLNKTIWLK